MKRFKCVKDSKGRVIWYVTHCRGHKAMILEFPPEL
jgi:hypothetical protein